MGKQDGYWDPVLVFVMFDRSLGWNLEWMVDCVSAMEILLVTIENNR